MQVQHILEVATHAKARSTEAVGHLGEAITAMGEIQQHLGRIGPNATPASEISVGDLARFQGHLADARDAVADMVPSSSFPAEAFPDGAPKVVGNRRRPR